MVLLDTSAWIHYLRNYPLTAEQLQRVVTCGIVIQEVLQGVRDDRSHKKLRKGLYALPCLSNPLPIDIFCEASEIYRSGRKRGLTIRSSMDCLIASIAMDNELPVMHKDRDFEAIAKFTDLKIEPLF